MENHKFKKKVVLGFIFIFFIMFNLFSRNIHISKSGDDSNPGTINLPYLTIQQGINEAMEGDIVLISPGIYREDLKSVRSGIEGKFITIKSKNLQNSAVVIGSFSSFKKSYLRIKDIRFQDAKNGIYIEGPCNNIEITGNHTYNTTSSGIAIWGVAWRKDPLVYENISNVIIRNNTVENACNGGFNECITLANGITDFEISNNEVFGGQDGSNGGEGIDVKEGAKRGEIYGNKIHGLKRQAGIYLDAGGLLGFTPPEIKDIKIYNNIVWNNVNAGAGGGAYTMGTEGDGSTFDILLVNNIAHNTGEDGFMIYKHPAGSGNIYNVKAINNTFVGNGRFGMLLNFSSAENIVYRNNICFGNSWENFKLSDYSSFEASNNLTDGTDPKFVDKDNADFKLRPDSPAIDAGTFQDSWDRDIENLPRFGAIDIGAHEYQKDALSINDFTFDSNKFRTKIFPNPIKSGNILKIESSIRRMRFRITDMKGALIRENKAIDQIQLDISPGLYIISFYDPLNNAKINEHKLIIY
ncbi:choice-of-anchor Q domain-containing protein [uncultured Aquimarina sp.]|uniref:choice-of-anchor Q domain-containing protein n=1 Tax=uncultured Aquimarina sp. TaxID=575652 RepID=UPI00260295AE|nr:choice-of-anchor Q domain-containing protein [uncultured Aquimarina sp.]